MNRTEFMKYLKRENISFTENKKEKVIVIDGEDLFFSSLESLPEGVVFNNADNLHLMNIKHLPKRIVFNNGDNVHLPIVKSLEKGTIFNNGGAVFLPIVKSLEKGTIFNNGGAVFLNTLTALPEGFEFNNGGNIDLPSITSFPKGIVFNNGRDVRIHSSTSFPRGVKFNNGGSVEIKDRNKAIVTPYIKRFKVERKGNNVYLYKRVSHSFKTQEGMENETSWKVGTTVEHPDWNPTESECGTGKFHACARPNWCSLFRNNKKDKFIKIEVNVKDLYEWIGHYQRFPQKIAFRKGMVVEEVKP